jgi:hypothetical protein
MPFLGGVKLKNQPFRYLNFMSNPGPSSEAKGGSQTKTFSTLKSLTKTGIKLQRHGKLAKRIEIEVKPTPPDAKLLAKYQLNQLIDLSASHCPEIETTNTETPGRVCSDVSRETNTKGKRRPVPTPRKYGTSSGSSSQSQIENKDSDESGCVSDSNSMPLVSSVSLQLPKSPSPTFTPKNLHSKSMSLPRKRPLSPCPSKPPATADNCAFSNVPLESGEPQSDPEPQTVEQDLIAAQNSTQMRSLTLTFAPKNLHSQSMSLPRKRPLSPCPSKPPATTDNYAFSNLPLESGEPQSEPESQTVEQDLIAAQSSIQLKSLTLPRSFPKSLQPEFPPEPDLNEEPTYIQISSFVAPASHSIVPPSVPSLKSTSDPNLNSFTCRDTDFIPKWSECFVSNDGFTLNSNALLRPHNLSSCKWIKKVIF